MGVTTSVGTTKEPSTKVEVNPSPSESAQANPVPTTLYRLKNGKMVPEAKNNSLSLRDITSSGGPRRLIDKDRSPYITVPEDHAFLRYAGHIGLYLCGETDMGPGLFQRRTVDGIEYLSLPNNWYIRSDELCSFIFVGIVKPDTDIPTGRRPGVYFKDIYSDVLIFKP